MKTKITDQELKDLYSSSLDLYKWKCTYPECQRFTKLWTFAELEPFPGRLYAWLRSGAMEWINNFESFWLCEKHFRRFNKNLLTEEQLDLPSKIILLKRNVRKTIRYSIIKKINK